MNRALTRGGLVDWVAISLALAVALAGFWPVFGGPAFIGPALAGVLGGAAVAWVGAWQRLSTAPVAVGLVAVYFLVGGAVALPTHTIAGVIPSGKTLSDLAVASITVWRQFLSATVPVASFEAMGLVPFIVGLVASGLALSLAWRVHQAAWALIPVGAAAVAVIAFGASVPFQPWVQAGLMMALVLSWLAYREAVGAPWAGGAGAAMATGAAAAR
ncbi:MAG: hypothetical protein LBE08_08030, partial [Bifidobacteriaceae bacterium]|nr:hypothetical protein [Bifidobacteriaceae bacterium]